MYWKMKTFKTKDNMDKWINANNHKYQIKEIFINNAYGIEYKKLLRIEV